MYQLKINDLSEQEFLTQFWQKKPLLIKQGFSNFQDPLDANELAGLAMEDSIESRIVTNHNNEWQSHQGPFEDFEQLTEQHSTLLVQAVDHWHNDAAQLLEPFRFIPNWRIDDLMISYSTPGGGVGPHLDQYDVFIIQGEGKRHWRVGLPDPSLKQFTQNKTLLQVEAFTAVIDCILEPGDILYIPPGCPHEGYAVENALNYSVGFRAPNQQDLLSSFADHIIDTESGQKRYTDHNLTLRESKGELSDTEVDKVKVLMQALLNDHTLFKQWLGTTLSQPKHDMDLMPVEQPFNAAQIADAINSDDISFERLGGTRAIYQQTADELLVSVNGENYSVPNSDLNAVKLLTDFTGFNAQQLKNTAPSLVFIEIFTTLINEGIWFN
ncbi:MULTISPECIES: cupin domain-containing protein [Pseudoalteromonas]|uniref:Enzyme with RmlC-like domain n=2 Tax=Pseudoalteromonas TaxID=53246 RepID=Q3IH13_PSET1|nr:MULTISPECIES: cupin domain-containing protein [Pseudoalteromonas]MBB1369490.1 cupin domain-containing protein [Pseudoalteromonas sp. SR45-4]MBB1404714.1 cupin domain-containing protein [Pseudoalteromonas sp. SG44-5]MBE0418702.1 cupin domain-containing protein [Pseudoalteromonas nigrifaciens]MBH0073050.1 cupin domain-containing protein [Pseudoalteromonas sp. NZS127]MBH0092683.1 cupin domain-containing protein [Pseudoalteromonas sp. SCQQ13]|tara:strand:- start:2637 stop:3782 length:1146 start_codon:yes stop_codon:yes gene_type:complete